MTEVIKPNPRAIADLYENGDLNAATHDRAHQALFAANSRAPLYAAAAPNVMDREPSKNVFLPRYMHLGMQTKYGSKFIYYPQYQERGTCFLAGTRVLMADGTEKAIDTIQPGDMVRSHDGTVQRVLKVGSRRFTGYIHSLRMCGSSRTVVATAEHPVLGFKRHRSATASHKPADWEAIKNIQPGDRVFVPAGFSGGKRVFDASVLAREACVRRYKADTVTEKQIRPKHSSLACQRFLPMDEELGFLVGIYAAEGCSDRSRVTLTMHENEEGALARCGATIEKLFRTKARYQRVTKNRALKLRANSRALQRFLTMLIPGTALTKRFGVEVFTACEEFRLGVLRGWFEGDGHLPTRRQIGIGVTSSAGLAEDIERLAATVGAKASIFVRKQAPHQNAPANEITFSGSGLGVITGAATKTSTRPKNFREEVGGFAVRVKSNTRIWIEGATVWNLEVEDTHSYIVAGVAVHNCVGQSHSSDATIVSGINALLAGLRFPGRAAVAPIYGGSRVDIGRNPGPRDGSTGSWAAAWLTKFGYVTLEEIGLSDNPADKNEWLKTLRADEQMACAWAASRDGVPTKTEDLAKQRPIVEAPLVTTVEEVRAAISNLSPVNLCGQVHPSQQLNERGVSKSIKRGGGHSTCIVGIYYDGSQWWYDHMQSWWYYYQGGFCRPDNKIDAQFKGCVTRVPESWLVSWLRERDCYAFVGVQGLEPIQETFAKGVMS